MARQQRIAKFICPGLIAAAALCWRPTFAVAEESDVPATKTTENQADGDTPSSAYAPSPGDIDQWIEQLGHDAYPVRQAAADELLKAGMPARERLLPLADGPDPEKRAAARRLVALIDRTEFERRLEEFAADADGKKGLTLPGWDRYHEFAGSDPAARALFVEMQRDEGPLLAAAFGVSTRPASDLWEAKLIRLVQRQAMNDPRGTGFSMGSAATLLFLAAVPELSSPRGASWVEHLVQRTPIRETLQAGTYRDVLRRLLVAWIFNCPDENEALLHRRLYLASGYELKEALPFAVSVALREGKYVNVQPTTRGVAMLTIGHLGGPQHVDRLEPLLDDQSVVANAPGQPVFQVQIRDVALVVMITLTDQRAADYGYVHARVQSQRMYQLDTLYFENDAQRSGAIAKWRAWRSEQAKAQRN